MSNKADIRKKLKTTLYDTTNDLSFIYHEDYGYSAILTTITDFEKKDPPRRPKVSSNKIYYHSPSGSHKRNMNDDPGKTLHVYYGDDYNHGKCELAEGLEVEADNIPSEERASLPKIETVDEDKGRYELQIERFRGPREDNPMLYHIVLPEHCYIDRDHFQNNTEDDIIIVTRENRQTIDLIYRIAIPRMSLGFIGPYKDKFDRLRIMNPKIYLGVGERFPYYPFP